MREQVCLTNFESHANSVVGVESKRARNEESAKLLNIARGCYGLLGDDCTLILVHSRIVFVFDIFYFRERERQDVGKLWDFRCASCRTGRCHCIGE